MSILVTGAADEVFESLRAAFEAAASTGRGPRHASHRVRSDGKDGATRLAQGVGRRSPGHRLRTLGRSPRLRRAPPSIVVPRPERPDLPPSGPDPKHAPGSGHTSRSCPERDRDLPSNSTASANTRSATRGRRPASVVTSTSPPRSSCRSINNAPRSNSPRCSSNGTRKSTSPVDVEPPRATDPKTRTR